MRSLLADGRRIDGDVLVGADGVHDVSANGGDRCATTMLHRPRRVLDAGARGAFQTNNQPAPAVTLWMGPHGQVRSQRVRGGQLYNVVAIVEQDWRDDGWRTPGDIEDVLAAYVGWSPKRRAPSSPKAPTCTNGRCWTVHPSRVVHRSGRPAW